MYAKDIPPGELFYHGSKADLKVGESVRPGFGSNFAERKLNHVYFSSRLESAVWGAELAQGEGQGRIYVVEPTGEFEDDPNLTDKKFPGNPTASYRSREPLRVIAEIKGWVGHTPEQLQTMRDGLAQLEEQGLNFIHD